MKKTTAFSKFFALLLALAMIIAVAGINVSAADEYKIYMGGSNTTGVQITSDNLTGTGWSFDPATSTLTLNDFEYDGTSFGFFFDDGAPEDLNIVLIGENTITGLYGFYFNSGAIVDCTISGTGSLDITSSSIGISGYSEASVTVNSGTVNVVSSTIPISVDEFIINGGELKAVSNADAPGITVQSNIAVAGGTLDVTGYPAIPCDTGVTFSATGGTILATSTTAPAIVLPETETITIQNTTLVLNTQNGVSLVAYGNLILDNSDLTVTTEAISAPAIHITDGDFIIKNDSTVVAKGGFGIYLDKTDVSTNDYNLIISDSTVTAIGDVRPALYPEDCLDLSNLESYVAKVGTSEEDATEMTSDYASEKYFNIEAGSLLPEPEPETTTEAPEKPAAKDAAKTEVKNDAKIADTADTNSILSLGTLFLASTVAVSGLAIVENKKKYVK